MIFLFKSMIFRFNVSFRGCMDIWKNHQVGPQCIASNFQSGDQNQGVFILHLHFFRKKLESWKTSITKEYCILCHVHNRFSHVSFDSVCWTTGKTLNHVGDPILSLFPNHLPTRYTEILHNILQYTTPKQRAAGIPQNGWIFVDDVASLKKNMFMFSSRFV